MTDAPPTRSPLGAAGATDRPASSIAPVRKEIELPCPPAAAFRMFTEEMAQWWPLQTHSIFGERSRGCGIDPRRGGLVYEIGPDGDRHAWGTVLAWEPPGLLAFTFHPGREPESAGTVEVRFQRSGSGSRVVLEHSGWEILGEKGLPMRENYDRGWSHVFGGRFYEHCAGKS
jgi:uncharacterized protein YndB with AHSA1/START domain